MDQLISERCRAAAALAGLALASCASVECAKTGSSSQIEFAADSFATLEINRGYDSESAMDISITLPAPGPIAGDMAEANGALGEYDEHDLDIQRTCRAICHLYGTDPEPLALPACWRRRQAPWRRLSAGQGQFGFPPDPVAGPTLSTNRKQSGS